MKQRAVACRDSCARKIKRAAAFSRHIPHNHGLHDAGIVVIGRIVDLCGERRNIGSRRHERVDNRAYALRIEGRQITLQVYNHVVAVFGIKFFHSREYAIGTGRKIGIGQKRGSAGALDCVGDFAFGCGNDDRSHIRRDRLPPHAHDHRDAGDVRKRFAGQSGRCHPRGYDDDRSHASLPSNLCDASPQ